MELPLSPALQPRAFYGTTVVRAAFVLAIFGWGIGFYSPAIFLHTVLARTGWALPLVSSAVTFHFLFGAGVVACLPRIHARLGVAATTAAGAAALALGLVGWALAAQPWQLFAAALLTGGGWVTMGAAGINAIISPWFVRGRPMALAKAYNGASLGGVIFSPLWGALIAAMGFTAATLLVGAAMLAIVGGLSVYVVSQTPERLGQRPDGDAPGAPARGVTSAHKLRALGVNANISTNNVLNPFTPFGDVSLIRMVNLYANVAQIGRSEDLADCLDLVTSAAAKLLNAESYGIAPGAAADLVVLDCETKAQAVCEIAPPMFGFKNGIRTLVRPAASVLKPA